jgi:hypothetical protein
MIGKTLGLKPDKKFYIYTDADTYIVWSNLLQSVKQMDSSKPVYLGNPTVIDGQLFAHGGSGYILSLAAMKAVDAVYKNDQERWDRFAANHWAGDCVLGTALEEAGVSLTWAFPLLQKHDPVSMDWTEVGYYRQLWCYPAISYHHVKPETIHNLWQLEQVWISATNDEPLRHGDVFQAYVRPNLPHARSDWDNLSDDLTQGQQVQDALGCRAVCENDSACLQYSFVDGICKTASIPKMGVPAATNSGESGWLLGRIHLLVQRLDNCHEGDWILP